MHYANYFYFLDFFEDLRFLKHKEIEGKF